MLPPVIHRICDNHRASLFHPFDVVSIRALVSARGPTGRLNSQAGEHGDGFRTCVLGYVRDSAPSTYLDQVSVRPIFALTCAASSRLV